MVALQIFSNSKFDYAHSYLIYDEVDKESCLIDPAGNADEIMAFIQAHKLSLNGIAITHGHFDHLFQVEKLLEKYKQCKLYINHDDAVCLTDSKSNLSVMNIFNVSSYAPFAQLPSCQVVLMNKTFSILPINKALQLEIIFAPGHTPGSCVYYSSALNGYFTGDVLFNDSVGRSDFYRSNASDMHKTLLRLRSIMSAHQDAKIFPGHGMLTTVGTEMTHNRLWDDV